MVLLYAAKRWRDRQIQQLGKAPDMLAIHVHHGLSGNADSWADFCQHQCKTLAIPLQIHRVQFQPDGNGIEQAARRARYQVFESCCGAGDCLLMGHHGDDQLETRLMRLTRGSGLSGLSGIPVSRSLSPDSSVQLVRPFLSMRRRELLDYAALHALEWIEDESNQDVQFERNWWRQEILPRIEERLPGRLDAMLASTRALQSDAAAFHHLLAPQLEKCIEPCRWPWVKTDALRLDHWQQAAEVLRSVLLRAWLQRLNINPPSQNQLEQLLVMSDAAGDANPEVKLGDWMIRRHGGCLLACDWRGEQQTRQQLQETHITLQEGRPDDTGLFWATRSWTVEKIAAGDYQISCLALMKNKHGLSLRPKGRPAKRLKHLWQEAGVPPWLRAVWPLLLQHGELRAIPGVAVDERNLVAL